MRRGGRLTRRFRRVPASLCLVATLVMVSPYQGKVNGILTLAGQQTKKPEYDTKKTPLPLHAVLRVWRGRSLYSSGLCGLVASPVSLHRRAQDARRASVVLQARAVRRPRAVLQPRVALRVPAFSAPHTHRRNHVLRVPVDARVVVRQAVVHQVVPELGMCRLCFLDEFPQPVLTLHRLNNTHNP